MLGNLFSWKWYWRTKLAFILIGIIGPLGYMFWLQSQGKSALAKLVAELDAAEPNWKLAELYAERNTRIQQLESNGWDQVVAVFESLPPGWDKDSTPISEDFDKLQPNQLPHAHTLQALRELLDRHQSSLGYARGMVIFPTGGREIEPPENPFTMFLTEIQNSRTVLHLLNLAAKEAAVAGRPTESAQAARAILNCSRAIGDEPILISQLVRIAGRAIATQTAKQMLALNESEAGLAELQAEFLREADVNVLAVGFRGERAAVHQTFLLMENGDTAALMKGATGATPGRWERLGLWAMRAYLPSNHKLSMEKLTELVKISELPFDEQWEQFKAIPQLPRGIQTVFAALLLPAMDKMAEAGLRSRGDLLATGVGLACERYRLKFKKWPDRLEDIPNDILSEIPNDPFTGKPLSYKHLADGVVVYSIGPDDKDNGGAVIQNSNQRMTDFGIRLWNPEFRRQSPPEPEIVEQDPNAFPGEFEPAINGPEEE